MHRLSVAAAALLLSTACGTTVPLAAQGQQPGGGDGLGPVTSAPDGTSATGTTGSSGVATSGQLPGPRSTAPGTGTTTGGPPPLPEPTSADRSPVKVGILYTINDAAPGAGIDNGNTFTLEAAYKGLVRAWNARGGVAGRRIEPTYVSIRSSSSSLTSDLEAACQTFTRDAKVAVVLASTGIYLEGFGSCLARAATPYVAGDYAFGDDTALAAAPGLMTPSTLTTDARLREMLEHLVAAGRMSRSDRIGVVVESCPFDLRTYDRTVVPTAERLGLTIADKTTTRCFSQIADLGGQAADMQNAVLRFASRNVTQVLFVSGSVEGNLMLYFATAAQAQAFHPHYALTSAVVASVQEANTPRQQLANAAGLGWIPALDRSADSPRTPAQARCLADLRRGAGVTPESGTDRFMAFSVCDTFALYDAALRRTAGHTSQVQVVTAVRALGTSFKPASTPAADFRGGRRAAAAQGRVFAWATGCACFDYTGPAFSLL